MADDLTETPGRRSEMACELCKNDRQLPTCSICHRTGRTCVYPQTRLKPGPKLGDLNSSTASQMNNSWLVGSSYTRKHRRSCDSHRVDATQPDFSNGDAVALYDPTLGAYHPRANSEATSSSTAVPAADSMALNFANAINVSSLFHPSHEAPPDPEPESIGRVAPGFLLVMAGVHEKLNKVCHVLNISILRLQSLIDLYFEAVSGLRNFSLFHQPTFSNKIRDMSDHNHLVALLAAMCSIASKTSPTSVDHAVGASISGDPALGSPEAFHQISLKYITMSLDACSNCAPSLCLLQAMALAGLYKSASGVYNSTWRLVGSAIRVAYELRLHLIDYEDFVEVPTSEIELRAWSSKEERRRCWWALWEMDIFVSTIQRAPTAIDWTMNETFLPVSDDFWFAGRYQASCLLQGNPEERLQRLKASGNEDCFAWCIVLSSLMRDAQVLSHGNIQGVFSHLEPKNNLSRLVQYYSHGHKRKLAVEQSQQLEGLVRAYHALLENLPTSLRHQGELLSFGLDMTEDTRARRRSCAGKYNIRMLSVSAHFMIYQNHVFAGIVDGTIPMSLLRGGEEACGRTPMPYQALSYGVGLKKLLDTSETVLELLESCPKGHARYVSPYYASTIWIAASLLLFKGIAVYDDDPAGTQRKYMALREAYLQYAYYWGAPLTLLQNLDSLETRLRGRQQELAASLGGDQTSRTNSRQAGNEAMSMGEFATGFTEANQDSPAPSEATAQESSYSRPLPLCDITTPMMGSWPSTESTVGLLEATATGGFLKINQDATTAILSQDATLDSFAWYSSDIINELSQGYTT